MSEHYIPVFRILGAHRRIGVAAQNCQQNQMSFFANAEVKKSRGHVRPGCPVGCVPG